MKSISGPSDRTVFQYSVHPTYVPAKISNPPGFPTPSQCEAAFGTACYTPAEIRSAYNVPASLNGSGQTIVIVDAFGSPTLASDLAAFDATFGLPNPTLNVFTPTGPASNPLANGDEVSWAVETSLDVEWAHSIAPNATIDLVLASSDDSDVLNQAQAFAVQHHLGKVMSLSFGIPEPLITGQAGNQFLLDADAIYAAALSEGMTVFASSGDFGATNAQFGFPAPNANFPASDPLVTAVGGTDLFMSDSGSYQSETVWNDSDPATCPFGCTLAPQSEGSTGGAPSSIFKAPDYQSALSHRQARTTSDVAYNASVYTAVLVAISFLPIPPSCPTAPCPAFYFIGGTSEGAPQWAGITALANQSFGGGQSVGFINPALYAIAGNRGKYARDFHDVTVGNNDFFGPGFSAGPGYDLPTGLGSPSVANLIHDLTQDSQGSNSQR